MMAGKDWFSQQHLLYRTFSQYPYPSPEELEAAEGMAAFIIMVMIFIASLIVIGIVLLLYFFKYTEVLRRGERDAIRSLRNGFSFSLITVSVSFAISLWYACTHEILLIGLPVVFVLFILGLCNRICAWGALKQDRIKWALSSEIIAFLLIFCFAGFCPLLFWFVSSTLYLLPVIAWIIATYMEARGFEWVRQNLNINLSLSKKLNIFGIIFFIIGVVIRFISETPYIPLITPAFLFSYAILFSYPFLIASCLSSITKLKPKPS
jgi:hypothetical protein